MSDRVCLVPAMVTVVIVAGLATGCSLEGSTARPEIASAASAGSATPTNTPTSAGVNHRPEETATALASQTAVDQSSAAGRACDGTALAAPAAPELATAVSRVAQQHGAKVVVSWVDPARGIMTAGGLTDLPSWSTVKVPLSLAVIDNGDGEVLRSSITSALRSSDNDAADRLWRSLGASDAARASAVTTVLRQAGDQTTTVPSTRLRPDFSVFGQTQWSTPSQVQFLRQLPCLKGANQVINDMGSVVDSQRWGLGTLPGATFKGGWGPTAAGGYTVRQFGWYVDERGTRVPLAIAVQASSFEAGVTTTNALASALS